jgi:hypothetical protein
MEKRQIIKINENKLQHIIMESIKMVLNESTNVVETVNDLINAANQAYIDAVNFTGDKYALMGKDGISYGLKELVALKRGRVIITYDDIYNSHIDMNVKVLEKRNGKIYIINGDYFDEGWKDVRKELNQIIKDAERAKQHMQNYDPNWEDADTLEDFKANKAKMKNFNKSIGLKADTGLDQIRNNF